MCGIAGMFDPQMTIRPAERAALLKRMCDVIEHHGVDDGGLYTVLVRSQVQTASPLLLLVLSSVVFSATYLAAFLAAGVLTGTERAAIRHQVIRLRPGFSAATLLTEGDYL